MNMRRWLVLGHAFVLASAIVVVAVAIPRRATPADSGPQGFGVPQTDDPTLWLLSIGVSRYKNRRLKLSYAEDDARAIIAAFNLEDQQRIYKSIETKLLANQNATRKDIIRGMREFLGQASPRDVAVIFMAGHGLLDPYSEQYYFLPYETSYDRPFDDGLPMAEITALLKARHEKGIGSIVLMLDACHAGSLESGMRAVEVPPSLKGRIEASEGMYILAAAKSTEKAAEAKRLRHGVFTHFILQGLSGNADKIDPTSKAADGFVTVSELFDYVSAEVPRHTKGAQNPHQDMRGTGLILAAVTDKAREVAMNLSELSDQERGSSIPPKHHVVVTEFSNDNRLDKEFDYGLTLQSRLATELDRVGVVKIIYLDEELETAGRRPSLDLARTKNAGTLVTGGYRVSEDGKRIYIHVEVVDVEQGTQSVADDEVNLDQLFDTSKELALRVLGIMNVAASPQERANIAAKNKSDNPQKALEAYQHLLQQEGIGEDTETDTPTPEPQSRMPVERRPWNLNAVASLLSLPSGSVAHAADPETEEQEIRALLEEYRLALEAADLDAIQEIRGSLSERQREGLQGYFENVKDFHVQFDAIEIELIEDGRYAVSFLRRDRFTDKRTGEAISLDIHLDKIAVRDVDGWKIKNKPPLKVGQRD